MVSQQISIILSTPGYVKQSLEEFEHNMPSNLHYGPSKYTTPTYGLIIKYVNIDGSKPINKELVRFI